MSGTELPKISDEMVREFNRAFNEACDHPDEMGPNDAARAGLAAALVASGYRREGEVLRHDEEVIFAAWDAAAELLGEAAKGARQRSISANYAEGLADAASTLAETVAELRARRPATALEQAQPLLAAGSEVESLEPVESSEGQERSEEKEHG